MQISLLGALDACGADGSPIVPTAAKPRQLLALLASAPGQVVTVDAVVDELWGDRPVRSAAATVQTYVMKLRRRIEGAGAAAAKSVLTTRFGGYSLEIRPEEVDIWRFGGQVEAGMRAADAGDDDAAVALLRGALALWRGPAFVDVATGPRLRVEVARLDELRLSGQEVCLDAELRLGRHTQLLAELTGLCGRHPLHEGFAARCMLALYRCGRTSGALQVYRGLRRTLVDELAVEPSAPVRRLHARMLASDPALDLRAPAEPALAS